MSKPNSVIIRSAYQLEDGYDRKAASVDYSKVETVTQQSMKDANNVNKLVNQLSEGGSLPHFDVNQLGDDVIAGSAPDFQESMQVLADAQNMFNGMSYRQQRHYGSWHGVLKAIEAGLLVPGDQVNQRASETPTRSNDPVVDDSNLAGDLSPKTSPGGEANSSPS